MVGTGLQQQALQAQPGIDVAWGQQAFQFLQRLGIGTGAHPGLDGCKWGHGATMVPQPAGLKMRAMDTPALARAVHAAYGLEGNLLRLAGENENYELRLADGRRWVLKLAPAGEAPGRIELEHEAVEAMAARAPGLCLPRLRPARNGRVLVELALDHTPGSAPRLARLLEFVPGSAWGRHAPASPAMLTGLGTLAAELALALGPIDRPAARIRHRWDLAQAQQHRAELQAVDEPARRALLDHAFERFAASLPDLRSVPHGLIHADLNDDNLMVQDGRLSGLLDFGDALHNPLINELAIALAYVLLDEPEPWAAGAAVVAAYHKRRPLSATEIELLYPLITARLAVSLITSAQRRRIDPQRAAWFVTEARAWAFMQRHGRLEPTVVADALARGTGVRPYAERGAGAAELLARRSAHVSRALSISYREPLKFMRGRGAYLLDECGRAHLDLYNNVCHVGHCHPHVVSAGARQMAQLNTNTRYLTDAHVAYVERLAALLPPQLPVVFLVNSGSEANELALRLARCHTGRQGVWIMDNAYHGHTQALIDTSPYKFMGAGGRGAPESWVRVLPTPDTFRGAHRAQTPAQREAAGAAYAHDVAQVLAGCDSPPAALMAETLLSCGGQVIPPPGYFEAVFAMVRAAGGVCILDEVQVGFGRVGSHFWAFQAQGVTPDIVVMGKPMGNGHPMAAVACTRAIAASFETSGMEFFATFGGNPVSCAIGSAVLDVIEAEGLQAQAAEVGAHALALLRELQQNQAEIGDVRGLGLFIGIELVAADGVAPATARAKDVVNALRRERILTGTDGPHDNVIKIKPPLVVNRQDMERFVRTLDAVLG
jgi:4-aminobutyrate aminotransferase-like enzyme/Ser/Thr protein kinase RdoA (MazF antagonist)